MFNNQIIEAVARELDSCLLRNVPAICLGKGFSPEGTQILPRSEYVTSLNQPLAKIWFCARCITGTGTVELNLPGLSGPKIILGDGRRWAAPSQDDAWLEVKGAFVGDGDPFQPKLVDARSEKLHRDGEA
jgi:hypothetical protein